jgi:DnaJ-class molecular chaperone
MPDNRCHTCHGRGGHIERDGDGEYIVPCADCLARGFCPRCSAGFDADGLYPLEAFICIACGWVVHAGRMQTREAEPQPPICPACDGRGEVKGVRCPPCAGSGIVKPDAAFAEDILRRIRAKLRRGEDENKE